MLKSGSKRRCEIRALWRSTGRVSRARPAWRGDLRELVKTASWSSEYVSIFHYRDRDQNEVDFVLENAAGEIVGIEVKSAASVTRRDFRGLDRLASVAGTAFIQGIVLYDGAQALSFADKLCALPVAALWS